MTNEYCIHENYGINGKGHLTLGGMDTAELAEKYGTPLYLLDEDKIRRQCKEYKAALTKYFGGGSRPFYASKALSFVDIYKIMKQEGMGIDIVSPGELFTAVTAGFDVSNACFHGNNKTDDDIEYGIKAGVGYFVVDNTEELHCIDKTASDMGKVQDILIRITPGIDPHTLKAINTGTVDSKFGCAIATGDAEKITSAALKLKNVRLCGFHCHIGSQIFDSEPFVQAGAVMIEFISHMRDRYGYKTRVLNLGGGIAVRYLPSQPTVDIDTYIGSMAEQINALCKKYNVDRPDIFLEPGRNIVAASGITLYTVGSVKHIEGYKTYVSIDGGMPDNPRYALYRSPYTVLCANKATEPAEMKCTVGGRCCESGDLIAEDIKIQNVCRGDRLAVLVTGAYNYSMASNYNRIPRPPIVMISNGLDRLSVRRESYEDLIRNECLSDE